MESFKCSNYDSFGNYYFHIVWLFIVKT